jgi:hypothetical protein
MTVAELIAHLQTFDPELEVLYQAYSDYQVMDTWQVVIHPAVDKGFYKMQTHPTMSQENKDKVKEYVLFPGN